MSDSTAKDDQLRKVITVAAQKIFQQYGLQKATMEDIAKAMGKGKSTLYYYFSSKEDIFQAVVVKEMNELFQKTVEACNRESTAAGKLHIATLTKVQTSRQKVNLYRALISEILPYNQTFERVRQQYLEQEMALYKTIISYGIDNGEFNKMYLPEIDFLANVIVNAFRGLETELVFNEKFPDLPQRMELLTTILTKGLK